MRFFRKILDQKTISGKVYPSLGIARLRGDGIIFWGAAVAALLLSTCGRRAEPFQLVISQCRRAWPPKERISSKRSTAHLQGFGRFCLLRKCVSSGRFLIQKTISGKVYPSLGVARRRGGFLREGALASLGKASFSAFDRSLFTCWHLPERLVIALPISADFG